MGLCLFFVSFFLGGGEREYQWTISIFSGNIDNVYCF